MAISTIEIIGFFVLRFFVDSESETKYQQNIINKKKVDKQIVIQKNKGKIDM